MPKIKNLYKKLHLGKTLKFLGRSKYLLLILGVLALGSLFFIKEPLTNLYATLSDNNKAPEEVPVSIEYSNENRLLNLKTDTEINKLVIERAQENNFIDDELEMERWRRQIDAQLAEYGDIARQYLPHDAITNLYETDIDHDGTKEKLVTLCAIGSNHCSDYAEVIKNNKVVFHTDFYANSRGIEPTEEGFYVLWTNEDSFRKNGEERGLCCEFSYNKTQFIYQNDKFTPIKQWKIFKF